MHVNVTFLIFGLCFSISHANDDDPVVTLSYGTIRGHSLLSQDNNTYYAFQEIPYASPPIGQLRFKPPIPPKSWDGILETKTNTKICYQQTSPETELTQTEDCLYLNVYTPQKHNDGPSEDLLPVFVWIHGGAYRRGDGTIGNWGPKFLIDTNIVIVTFNYRLGPLGFLTTDDDVIPGNLGLKDQSLALKWVKDNIVLFGGDPEKITIGGHSAGSFSVGYQVISKQNQGLFRAAILGSGTALSPGAYQAFPREFAFQVGKSLDPTFSSQDSHDLLDLLLNVTAEEITNVNIIVLDDIYGGGLIWTPVVEKEYDGAFITTPMEDDVRNGNINQVPIMIGFTTEEELTFVAADRSDVERKGDNFDKTPARVMPMVCDITDRDRETAGSEIKKLYTDGTFGDDFAALVKFLSDTLFTIPSIRHGDLQSRYIDVYMYQFAYSGTLGGNAIHVEGLDNNLVGHGQDLAYFWDRGYNSDLSKYPEGDILTSRRVIKMCSNFIKYLNPTPEEDSLLQNVTWSKVTTDSLNYLNINETLEIKTDPKLYQQWKQIVDKYARPPFVTY